MPPDFLSVKIFPSKTNLIENWYNLTAYKWGLTLYQVNVKKYSRKNRENGLKKLKKYFQSEYSYGLNA
jgi:hypothetical protein